jgi:glutamine amidotransferase
MIVILDYGMGNVASVANMIRKVGGIARLSGSPDEVRTADKIVLPGVGSFDPGMKALAQSRLDVALREAVTERGATVLGICLGMQLLFDASEEGTLPGLGFVRGHVRRFDVARYGLRVPHMGWNVVREISRHRLFAKSDEPSRYYFVHSYHAECAREEDVSAVAHYGYDFACAVEHGNVMGVQFHPEKSHRFGMALLKRFVQL